MEDKRAAGITSNYTTLRLEALFPLPLITFAELEEPPFRRFRWGIRSSGTYLPESIADALEELWEERVGEKRREPGKRAGKRASGSAKGAPLR